jgi:dinuclear metal center YbgI/SA1388 family protein
MPPSPPPPHRPPSLALADIVEQLERIAPTRFAEDWDNVGLILAPLDAARISKALLTIDLTEAVLDEALEAGVQFIIAYHPPIFSGLKRLTLARPQERTLLRAIRAGMAIYSPHTSLDAAPGGVNDWLADAVGAGARTPLMPSHELPASQRYKLVVFVPIEKVGVVRTALGALPGVGRVGNYSSCSYNADGEGMFLGEEGANPAIGKRGELETVKETRIEMLCSRSALPAVARTLSEVHPYEEPAWDVYPLEPKPQEGTGMGRRIVLDDPVPASELVARIKQHTGLRYVRFAECASHRHEGGQLVRTVAVCAGAGGGLFEKVHDVDFFLTGEMRHHDVLAKNASGASVVLCDHTNTERGFLPTYRDRILAELAETPTALEILIAESDKDPLEIV